MRIQISDRQLRLLQEALRDEIPPYMRNIIANRYDDGEKFLDMDVPEHSPLIPEVTKEIVDEEMREEIYKRISSDFDSKIDRQFRETKIYKLLNSNLDIGLLMYKSVYPNPISTSKLDRIYYSNEFKLLQAKDNNLESPIFSNNKSNLYKFLLSVKRAFPELLPGNLFNPDEIINDKIFVGLRNPVINRESILKKLSEARVYLYISAKPYDILRMSVSDFYDSCQNIYTGGRYGTEYNKKLLSNVFDKNSKVAFLIFDAPFIDKMGNKHKNSPVARMIIRTTPDGTILFDQVYPREMESKMYKIVTDLTGLQNSGKPGDLYHYTAIEGLPSPYMDRYRLRTTNLGKEISNNPRANVLCNYFNIDLSDLRIVGDDTFKINLPYHNRFTTFQVLNGGEAEEALRDQINSQISEYLKDQSLEYVFIETEIILPQILFRVFNDLFESSKTRWEEENPESIPLDHQSYRVSVPYVLNDWDERFNIVDMSDLWRHDRNRNNQQAYYRLFNGIDEENFIKYMYHGNKYAAMNDLLGGGEEVIETHDLYGNTWYFIPLDNM